MEGTLPLCGAEHGADCGRHFDPLDGVDALGIVDVGLRRHGQALAVGVVRDRRRRVVRVVSGVLQFATPAVDIG